MSYLRMKLIIVQKWYVLFLATDREYILMGIYTNVPFLAPIQFPIPYPVPTLSIPKCLSRPKEIPI